MNAATMTVPPGFFKGPPDREIAALDTCLRALLPLDPDARGRVLEYLDDRLNVHPGPSMAHPDPQEETTPP